MPSSSSTTTAMLARLQRVHVARAQEGALGQVVRGANDEQDKGAQAHAGETAPG